MMIISLQDVLSRPKRVFIFARLLGACRSLFVVTLLFAVPIHSIEMNPLQHHRTDITDIIDSAPSPMRARELRYLLKHDCGSCHGMTLKGGLGPALTREALQGRSRSEIASVILHGRASLAMPPWSPFLSQEEAFWLAGILKEEL